MIEVDWKIMRKRRLEEGFRHDLLDTPEKEKEMTISKGLLEAVYGKVYKKDAVYDSHNDIGLYIHVYEPDDSFGVRWVKDYKNKWTMLPIFLEWLGKNESVNISILPRYSHTEVRVRVGASPAFVAKELPEAVFKACEWYHKGWKNV